MNLTPSQHPLSPDIDSPAPFYQQLTEEWRIIPRPNRPERRHYVGGEVVCAEVKGLDGQATCQTEFEIVRYVGSGFAGQVYQAKADLNRNESPVALKVLRPRWKENFRNALFRMSFLAPFAPQTREPALRAGLIWQEIIRLTAAAEFDQVGLIPQPLGYFWDADLFSFVEIQEWVEGRAVRYQFDQDILLRWLGQQLPCPDSEMRRKKIIMAQLVSLCHRLGAIGLARQYEWYTLVSQDNALTRHDNSKPDLSEFIAVDWRPGLAVPFFLPLSPVHARLIWRGLWRGQWVHFDEVDLGRLEKYLQAHRKILASVGLLIDRLKEDEAQYRAGQFHVWPTRPRLPMVCSQVQQATVDEWQRRNLVSPAQAESWQKQRGRFWLYFALEQLPIAGRFWVRWWGQEQVRTHWFHFFTRSPYRQNVFRAYRAKALLSWVDEGRVPLTHAAALAQSLPRYWFEAWSLGWLPRRLHRLGVDAAARHQWFITNWVTPLQLLLCHKYRVAWLDHLIQDGTECGLLPPQTAPYLLKQNHTAQMAGFGRDLILTLGLEFFAKLLYVLLAVYGVAAAHWFPLIIALLGPVSPSGIVRTMYILAQLIFDLPQIIRQKDGRLFLARASGLLVAPWRFLGNLCVPLEMSIYYPEMALFLCSYLVIKLARHIPILGGRGTLLEYELFMLISNFPVALQYLFATLLHIR